MFHFGNDYRGNRSLDESVGANQHRMPALGKAIYFHSTWEDLLQHWHTGDSMDEFANMASLPCAEAEFANAVSILLKTAAHGDDSGKSMASLLHQAIVRHDVVGKLIASLKQQGHRAYRHLT